MKNLICGIDPGMSGGIALLNEKGRVELVVKMPATEEELARFFREQAPRVSFAVIERLQPMFKTSKVAMFKLGRSYGTLRGVLTALRIPFVDVRPVVWQTHMKCLTKGDKKVTHAKAQRRWPKTKVTHAIADSLLIAEFGRRFPKVHGFTK